MVRHGFADRPCTGVVEAAAHTVALQAQDLGQARLGIRARTPTATEADVSAALSGRAVVRTWLMRSTIHLAAAADLRWLVRVFGPLVRRRNEPRWAELGLPAGVLERVERLAPALLADGPLTRHAFAGALRERGVAVPPGQAVTHLLVFLASTGLTCHADGDRFALTDAWLPAAAEGPHGDDALAELARRYFAAFSPATGADFTAWSGLPSGAAIRLISDELDEVDVNGRRGYRLGPPADGGGLRLISGFDNYLVGYRDRTGVIADERRREVFVGGIIRATVLYDGVVAGRWRLDRARGRVEVVTFGSLPRSARDGLDREVDDLGRFVGRELAISVGT